MNRAARKNSNGPNGTRAETATSETSTRLFSRRGLVGMIAGTAALGVTGYAVATQLTAASSSNTASNTASNAPGGPTSEQSSTVTGVVAFDGQHQAGIATPAQGHMVLSSYDVNVEATKAEVAAVMKAWTAAARAMTSGKPFEGDPAISNGSGPANLTVTVGVGASLVQRFGAIRPRALADVPAFAGDDIDPARSAGDIVVQLCADDPLVLAQADRVLARLAEGTFTSRWHERGFGSTGARRDGKTGRNLMGQLDGTNNVTTSQLATAGPIWVNDTEPAWMAGGSYLVFRRIRMLLNEWDHTNNEQQERSIGRTKVTGAPLGSEKESDFVDLEARTPSGELTIPEDSHVRLAKPQSSGENMMRRGYSYQGGVLADGTVDQGLLFLAYQKDPTTSFIPVQQRLAKQDALSKFLVTTGSAVFAILPGTVTPSGWLGSTLFS